MAIGNSPVRKWLSKQEITSFEDALHAANPRPPASADRAAKKNYAQYLSEALAVLFANQLRHIFPGILPAADGSGLESAARTGKGVKKLDVNYSTPQLGLGLGISIKTLNFRDPKSGRYTKNPTRLDNELRAEAMDYHQRQPYSVLVAVIFVPLDSCEDGDATNPNQSRSSFAQIVNVLRHRGGRRAPSDDAQLFEKVYIGLYGHAAGSSGQAFYFDTECAPPQFGYPADTVLMSFEELLEAIVAVYDDVNTVVPAWETETDAHPIRSFEELQQSGLIAEPADDEDETSNS
jgi:hypothetical protein